VELILINANAGVTFNDAPVSSLAETPRSCPMSELGPFQKSARTNAMSAFHPIATESRTLPVVRFVPKH
jgi:hypothetical protein